MYQAGPKISKELEGISPRRGERIGVMIKHVGMPLTT